MLFVFAEYQGSVFRKCLLPMLLRLFEVRLKLQASSHRVMNLNRTRTTELFAHFIRDF